MSISLTQWIDAQPRFLGDNWIAGLEDRKREEASFHDSDRADHRDEQTDAGNRRFYDAAEPPRRYMRERIATLSSAGTALDYACGNGTTTIDMARSGAVLAVGLDISEISVRNATESAAKAGVSDKTRFLQRDCEATGLPADSFDFILCSGMLHHLDLSRAFPELHRLLKPGGRILCGEALNYNPFIKLYRRMTPQYRTDWEWQHILSMKEVRYAKRWFNVENIRFFGLAAPLAAALPKSSVRSTSIAAAHVLDAVLTRVPLVQLWSWQFVFELVKPV